jgi:hypothetical protein
MLHIYAGTAGILLQLNGKFTIEILKSSFFVLNRSLVNSDFSQRIIQS